MRDTTPLPSVLRAGTTGDYAPFSIGRDGRYHGFDIDLLAVLGARLGKPVELHAVTWPTLTDRLAGDDLHLVASGITVTPGRRTLGLFTRPYLANRSVVVGPAASPAGAAAPPDFAGIKLGVNRGGYLETVARAAFPRAEIVPVDANPQLPAGLRDGRFAFFMSDTLETAAFAQKGPLTVVAELEAQEHALLVAPRQAALRSALNDALQQLYADKTMERLTAAYGIPAACLRG